MSSRTPPQSVCYSVTEVFSRPPRGVSFSIVKGTGPVYGRRILSVTKVDAILLVTVDEDTAWNGSHLPITDIVLVGDIDKCLDAGDDDLAAMWLANDNTNKA